MNAIPKWSGRLIDIIRDDVRHGAPGAHLEPHEVPQWVQELNEAGQPCDMVNCLVDSMSETDLGEQRDKLNKLLTAAMAEKPNIYDVLDLVELMQQSMKQYCIRQADKMLEMP